MINRTQYLGTALLLLFGLAMGPALAVTTGEKVKTEGLIVARQRDSVTLRTADQGDVVVLITAYTKIVTPHGLLEKKNMPLSSLLPGLWVKVEGVGNSPGHMLALTVSFSGNDLRTAKAIQGGLTPLETRVQANEQQIQTNVRNIQAHEERIQVNRQDISTNQQGLQQLTQRFSDLTDYDVRSTAFVYFPVGSSSLSPQARNELLQVASNAQRHKGYLIQVKAYTDSAGRASLNQDLSVRRAQSVIAFLEENGNIPLTNVLTPGAMGETYPLASNESSAGRAQNRRAEIKILINRGLSGE